jgi:hypothetical protein
VAGVEDAAGIPAQETVDRDRNRNRKALKQETRKEGKQEDNSVKAGDKETRKALKQETRKEGKQEDNSVKAGDKQATKQRRQTTRHFEGARFSFKPGPMSRD